MEPYFLSSRIFLKVQAAFRQRIVAWNAEYSDFPDRFPFYPLHSF
jgi:hypothetical protein